MGNDNTEYGKNIYPFQPLDDKTLGDQSPSGGGGDSMEPRIAKLEADVSYIKNRLDEASANIRTSGDKISAQSVELAVLAEKAKHFATKSYSIVTAAAIVAALSGLILFADRLRSILGIS